MPIKPTKKPNENSDCRITTVLKGFDDETLLKADMVSATYSLYNKKTNKIINAKEGVDVKNLFTDESDGLTLTMVIPATDNIIVDKYIQKAYETHIAQIVAVMTISGASVTHTEEIWINVQQLRTKV